MLTSSGLASQTKRKLSQSPEGQLFDTMKELLVTVAGDNTFIKELKETILTLEAAHEKEIEKLKKEDKIKLQSMDQLQETARKTLHALYDKRRTASDETDTKYSGELLDKGKERVNTIAAKRNNEARSIQLKVRVGDRFGLAVGTPVVISAIIAGAVTGTLDWFTIIISAGVPIMAVATPFGRRFFHKIGNFYDSCMEQFCHHPQKPAVIVPALVELPLAQKVKELVEALEQEGRKQYADCISELKAKREKEMEVKGEAELQNITNQSHRSSLINEIVPVLSSVSTENGLSLTKTDKNFKDPESLKGFILKILNKEIEFTENIKQGLKTLLNASLQQKKPKIEKELEQGRIRMQDQFDRELQSLSELLLEFELNMAKEKLDKNILVRTLIEENVESMNDLISSQEERDKDSARRTTMGDRLGIVAASILFGVGTATAGAMRSASTFLSVIKSSAVALGYGNQIGLSFYDWIGSCLGRFSDEEPSSNTKLKIVVEGASNAGTVVIGPKVNTLVEPNNELDTSSLVFSPLPIVDSYSLIADNGHSIATKAVIFTPQLQIRNSSSSSQIYQVAPAEINLGEQGNNLHRPQD